MREIMLKLMDTLSRDVITAEAAAVELTEAALALSNQPEAKAIRDIALSKRAKAIELRGQLAALRNDYAVRFGSDP